MRMATDSGVVVLSLVLASVTFLARQAAGEEAPIPEETASYAEGEAVAVVPEADPEEVIEKRIETMETALDGQSQEIEQLKAESKTQKIENEKLKEKISEIQDEMTVSSVDFEDVETTQLLSIFGFFDLTYFKGFYNDKSLYQMYLPPKGTFTVTNVNLYLTSQMTESLSAIMELRFSFLPHGYEREYKNETHLANGTVVSNGAYRRIDTTVMDPVTTLEFQQGGLTIERVHLTYAPFDWLNVIAGRFLTPYGIWNIDHGSPVVLPARIPDLQYRALMPLAQTGIQVYGRFFPGEKSFFDYALTLSNGRGPIDALMDLDENKGVGLRLKLTYSGKNISFFTGVYGYTGEYTDSEKIAIVKLNDDYTLDRDEEEAMAMKFINTEAYREYAISCDFSLSIFDFRLDSEAVWRRVKYSKHPTSNLFAAIANGASAMDVYYTSDYLGYGVYVLLSYRLPLPEGWRPLQITPYVMYERGDPFEVLKIAEGHIFYAGLNIKPSPYVTLKGEFMRTWPDTPLLEKTNAMTLQMAVSF